MEILDYIRREFASMRGLSGSTMTGMTDELLNAPATGVANTIGATLIHLISSEEFFTQKLLQGKPMLWDDAGWNKKVGLDIPSNGDVWTEVSKVKLSLTSLLQYQEAVCAETEAYLNSLKPEDLDRKVDMFGQPHPVADVLALVINHETAHLGEIAALKGIHGTKGLPY
jgi:uncharacterized damage-inducible protein DinB